MTEPFETGQGWVILRLVEVVDPQVLSIDDARGSVEAAFKQLKNDERLNELLEKWREEYGVIIHEDNLNKIEVDPLNEGARVTT